MTDLRLALRALRRAPAFAATAVLVLGIAIAAASATAALYERVLLRPLPLRDAGRVVVPRTFDKGGVELAMWPEELDQLRHESRTLAAVGGFAHWGAHETPLNDGDRSLVLQQAVVTGHFFDALGARAALGRLLRPEDDAKGAPRTMVLSWSAWRRAFGGDSSVIGRTLVEPYQRVPVTIVGVAPPGLDYPAGAEYWMPIRPFGRALVSAVGRLAPGATAAAARDELLAFAKRVDATHEVPFAPVRAEAPTMTEVVTGGARPMLRALALAVALLLAVACVNVGNLVLLRATGRARELAVRRALGGGALAVARPLAAEGLLLGASGAALGLVGATALLRLLVAVAPAKLPRLDVVAVGGAPVGIALGVGLAVALVAGVLPALVAARVGAVPVLRHDARAGRESAARRRGRNALVAVQVALALVMLAGAALLARSLRRLERQPLGYTASRLSIVTLAIPVPNADAQPTTTTGTPVKFATEGARILARLRTLSGVTAATPVVVPPFIGTNAFLARLAPADAPAPNDVAVQVPWEVGGPDYFRTLGTPLLRGRPFRDGDTEHAPGVAVISESLARRFWPDGDALGKRLRAPGDTGAGVTVVGVAADVRLRDLRQPAMAVYFPWQQGYWQGLFAIRTDRDLAQVLPGIRRVLREVDPEITVWRAQTMDDYLDGPLAQPRLGTALLSAFGGVALLLAAIGLYGVMASAVRERTREIGVRMTLGATPGRVRGEVLRGALAVVAAGAAAGLAAALATTRLLASLLYEVAPTDPVALFGACAVLVAVAALAAWLPARHATRVDPARALRAD